MNSADVAGLLELLSKESPDLLGPLVSALEFSPAGRGIGELAKRWGVSPDDRAAELVALALKTAEHLDRLERQQLRAWRHPREVLGAPNLAALHSFARRRSGRVPGISRSRRLEVIGRKLERVYEVDRRRQRIESFLSEPAPAVDPEWLRDFLS